MSNETIKPTPDEILRYSDSFRAAQVGAHGREWYEGKVSPTSPEAKTEAVTALASTLHENWRKTRLNDRGEYDPRIKPTRDEVWVEAHGTDQVDIANTAYEDLPVDWQAENKAAAEVVVGILDESNGNLDLSNTEARSQVGQTVHKAWLSRNEWAKGGELDKPFEELPPEEQAKDIVQ